MKQRKWIKIAIAVAAVLICLIYGVSKLYRNSHSKAPSYERHITEILQMEQTDLDSPISGIRTGVNRSQTGSLASNEIEYTDKGVYFFAQDDGLGVQMNGYLEPAGILFYSDRDSNTVIKLCGRPDCTHDNFDCNAYVEEAYGGISYYDGHLYYAVSAWLPNLIQLWRMDTDGSNRVSILTCETVNFEGKYTGCGAPFVMNGVFIVPLHYVDDSSELGFSTDWYYCKLDGFSTELKLMPCGRGWNDGEAFLVGSPLTGKEGELWKLQQWDPDTNKLTVLAELPLTTEEINQGYFGVDAGYCHIDGMIKKISYPDGQEEPLFKTGITGKYITRYYPDCIAICEVRDYKSGDYDIIHFFSWDGEKLGTVVNDFAPDLGIYVLAEETKDRILLLGNIQTDLPEYYIEKSDLGTGNIEVHRYQYVDMTEEQRLETFGEE